MINISDNVVQPEDVEQAETISKRYPRQQAGVFTSVLTAILVTRRLDSPPPAAAGIERRERPLAPTEFFSCLKGATEVDKVLGAAYFLEVHKGLQSFTGAALNELLFEARVKPPRNVSLAILRNAQRGRVMETGKKHGGNILWRVTQTGIDVIERLLQPNYGAHISDKKEG